MFVANYTLLQKIARLTGLDAERCAELLNDGWTYYEGVLRAPGWIPPETE